MDEAWLCFAVPTVVSEPETDFVSSSSVGCVATMPMLAAREGWCDLLTGIEVEAVAAARVTLPLLSVPAAAARGIAFIVVTRGMRLDKEADLLGETVRLPTLGLDEGMPLAAVLAAREGV